MKVCIVGGAKPITDLSNQIDNCHHVIRTNRPRIGGVYGSKMTIWAFRPISLHLRLTHEYTKHWQAINEAAAQARHYWVVTTRGLGPYNRLDKYADSIDLLNNFDESKLRDTIVMPYWRKVLGLNQSVTIGTALIFYVLTVYRVKVCIAGFKHYDRPVPKLCDPHDYREERKLIDTWIENKQIIEFG